MVLTSGSLDDATANALCYKCHDRTSIIAGTSFSEHEKHVSGAGIVRASCLACHDPHGVETQAASDTSHLINLDRAVRGPFANERPAEVRGQRIPHRQLLSAMPLHAYAYQGPRGHGLSALIYQFLGPLLIVTTPRARSMVWQFRQEP